MTGLGLLKRRTEQERDQTKRQYGRGGGGHDWCKLLLLPPFPTGHPWLVLESYQQIQRGRKAEAERKEGRVMIELRSRCGNWR